MVSDRVVAPEPLKKVPASSSLVIHPHRVVYQLEDYNIWDVEVAGSSPVYSTKYRDAIH